MAPNLPTDVALALFPTLILAFIVYDFVVLTVLGPRLGTPTLTRRVYELSEAAPGVPALVCLFVGWAIGHLFPL